MDYGRSGAGFRIARANGKGSLVFPYKIFSGVAFSAVSCYFLYESSIFPREEMSNVQPGTWPFFLASLMLVMSIGLIVETCVRRLIARRQAAEAGIAYQDDPAPFAFKSRGMVYVYILCAIFLVFSLLLHYVNFTVASVFLIPSCMRLLGEKRRWMLAIITAGIPIIVYIIFAKILGIQLP